jgi:hypothetical protein
MPFLIPGIQISSRKSSHQCHRGVATLVRANIVPWQVSTFLVGLDSDKRYMHDSESIPFVFDINLDVQGL